MTKLQEIPQVVQVRILPSSLLEILFHNGEKGYLQLSQHLAFTGYFAPLADAEFFNQVYVDHGTLCWPKQIDLDPVVVYAWTFGIPIELASPLTIVA
ncbi:MAG: DUF2442 domain-containing protein [Caldilineaceae bacterium]